MPIPDDLPSAPGQSKPPRRIAWLADGHEAFGIARTIVSLACALRRRGESVLVVCLEDGEMATFARSFEIETVVVGGTLPTPNFFGGLISKPRQLLQSWRFLRHALPKVIATLKSQQVDVIHVVMPTLVSLASKASRAIGAPCFWEVPNAWSTRYPFDINRRIYRHTLRSNGVIVLANSEFTAAGIKGPGVTPIVFYAATDETSFDPAVVVPASRKSLGIPQTASVIGIFARMTGEKGQLELIRAVAAIRQEGVDLHLISAGGPLDGDYANRVKAEIKTLGLSDRIHLLPAAQTVAPFIAACDVTANCRLDPEPLGLSIIESMLLERPTLVHASGGPTETVLDGRTGWHIADMRHETIVAGLRRVIADRPRWREMGQAGRARALKHFTASRLADHYIRLLDQISAGRR